MIHAIRIVFVLLIVAAAAVPVANAEEKSKDVTLCTMEFDLKGWSLFYATGSGQGSITCDNGQSAKVALKLTGGGLTAGKSTVRNATGRFTEVSDISELYGGWAAAGASAAAGKSAGAGVVTKGDISLTLLGTGTGVQLGFGGAKLTIKPAGEAESKKDVEAKK